jgi:Winged helix DNA-binding domain
VQVPPRGLWGRSGAAAHTSLERWLEGAPPPADPLAAVVRRYLAAFGPASVQDLQKWSGLTRLAPVVDGLRDELVAFTDAATGRVLLDLPDAPRPPGDTPIAPRLVGPFDNLVLSHVDTTRVVAAEHRSRVMTKNGLIAALVLIDGFAAGSWRIEATKARATLAITAFGSKPYGKADRAALEREGRRLLAFAAPEAAEAVVSFGCA